ncbi:MAG: HEAT repeat domain-containing protein [Planctomycetales bacterium]|nr:HEAT repeat domain-containing protein [Planctomycetales bacterium]
MQRVSLRPCGLCLFVWAALFAAAGPSRAAEEAASPYKLILKERGIDASAEALGRYLTDLHPTKEQLAKAVQLIEQLGDPQSFHARESAMSALLIMPTLPTEALVDASRGEDPEIRWRAKRVLDMGKPEAIRMMHAAFKVIAEDKTAGLMPQLLAALPLCDKRHVYSAALEAVEAVASEKDLPLLRESTSSDNVNVREAAVLGLASALGDKAAADLAPMLADKEDAVQLAAARALANLGDRRSLAPLVKLLSSDDLMSRVSASVALRQLTGQHFSYAAYDSVDNRVKSIKQWNAWLADAGKTAELTFPLKRFGSGNGYLAGNMLLAFGYQNKVAEFDPGGKEIWSYPGQGAWSAEKMANGNVLVAEYNAGKVTEVDARGKVVWQYDVQNPLNAKPLENGNVLIAHHAGNLAIEVTPDKRIVWQYQTKSNCSDVHRLENGNTLIASYGSSVIEVTPDGKTAWEFADATQSYGCQPLENGNILIANFDGRVMEVTREKKIIWEFQEQGAVDAFRLPSGNTLITNGSRFIEVTPEKKIVWEKSGCSYGTARR